ncbi:MAG: DUF2232 domain-containing protein [Bacillota bacterium]|nr:DUF2232 domain-containing protein [Bacillota bacterium]
MKTNQLTNAAIFAAISAIFMIGALLPIGWLFQVVALPVTMAILSMKADAPYVFGAAFVAFVIASLVINPVNAMLSVPSLAVGFCVGIPLSRGESLYYTAVFGAVSSIATLTIFYLAFDLFEISHVSEFKLSLEAFLEDTLIRNPGYMDVQMIPAVVALFIQLIPSSIVVSHYIFGMICALVAAYILRKMGIRTNIEPFSRLIMSGPAMNLTVLITFIVFLATYIGGSNIFLVNILSVLMTMAGIVGLAGVIGLIFSAYSKKFVLLLAMLFLHMIMGPLMFYVYAIIDAHYDFRGVRRKMR